ncbi:MAG TPA: serine/threonine-protein kinase [Homoserinimonas sp.]|nr:serine/threonine-protein kinase [Homoserinimonas sp.]
MTGTDVDNLVGSLLADRFRISALLGRGGMATVYLAEDESLGRPVAVKVFRRDLADGDDLQRQQDEIQLLATLNHPSLVTLFDASTDEAGNAYLVMELVDGTDLHSRLRDGALDPGMVATIGQNLADALVYVHSKGVIHRDIKPGNILLPHPDADHTGPQAKLADFGIARIVDGSRLTATGKILGTATYFSPEQALGDPLAPASDIYSLGLVLLECLTGEKSFAGSAVESMMARLSRDPEVPAELGDSWVGLLKGMTNRAPDARPTARDVSGVLGRLAEPADATRPYPVSTDQTQVLHPSTAPVLSPASGNRSAPRPRRRRVLIVAVVAAALLLAWPTTLAISSMFPPAEPETVIEYPTVDGTLGTHLEQLQRSVEP